MFLFRDSDGKAENILTSTSAFENYDINDKVLFNDNSGWIIIYSPDLSEIILAKEFPDNKSYVHGIIRDTPEGRFIYAMVLEMNLGSCFLDKISMDGETVKRVHVADGMNWYTYINTIIEDLEPLTILHSDTLHYFDEDLNLLSKEKNAGEIIFTNEAQNRIHLRSAGFFPFSSGDWMILRDTELKIVAKIRMKGIDFWTRSAFSEKFTGDKEVYEFSLNSRSGTSHFEIKRNEIFSFRVGIYILLYAMIYFSLYLLFRMQNYFYNKKNIADRRISELQLQTVQNQLQPHFTFNVLNAIGAMIYQNRKEEAYQYLNNFSDMLRNTLLTRSRAEWSVLEELKFIQTYIDLENLRFNNRFTYIQEIDEGANLHKLVPKLAVQAFIENAVKHGLVHKTDDCILKLSIQTRDMHLKVKIEDNGIGRVASEKLQRDHNGIGNQILSDFIRVYNRSNKIKFKIDVQDLTDQNGVAAGTRVVMLIPLDFKSANQMI
jgi:hypothetical protein